MWLRDTNNHLYAKYREDCEANGRRPISETKFRQGLNAGNFKEMVQMVGLCNICDEIGARIWECLDNIIDELKNEISNSLVDVSTLNEDMQEINDEDDYEEVIDKSKMVMIDISETDTEYCQTNPLPKDSPILMIHVGVAEKLSDYACNKNGAMNDFHSTFSGRRKDQCLQLWLVNRQKVGTVRYKYYNQIGIHTLHFL